MITHPSLLQTKRVHKMKSRGAAVCYSEIGVRYEMEKAESGYFLEKTVTEDSILIE